MITKADDGYYHPKDEAEIAELVKHAVANGLNVRVRGSGHSEVPAILTGNFSHPSTDDPNINLYLDNMIAVRFDDAQQQVTVEAGCHLGEDPADITHTSTLENSLFYQIDQRGWAFPGTGGIIHQTVGGFMLTGSSGGNLHHSVGRQIRAIRAVDGLGNIHEFKKSDDLNDPFYAMGVSMGVLGVITSVTFQCVDRFEIAGVETTSGIEDCEIDLFGSGQNGKPSLAQFFRDADHARVLWFPQQGVDKIIVWKASPHDAAHGAFKRKPYREFPVWLGSEVPAQVVASLLFRLFDILNPPEPTTRLRKWLRGVLKPFYPIMVNYFLASAVLAPQKFQDTWWQGLPMDNNVNYDLMPVQFTEMWFPVAKAAEVMQELRRYFKEGGFDATGTDSCEIYATPSSNFWLSPAYQQDVIKLDPFWFGMNRSNPHDVFYPGLWACFKKHHYRLHWGKALSGDADYLRQQYPRWDDFMKLREQLDPHQIFVTEYWRKNLGIPPV